MRLLLALLATSSLAATAYFTEVDPTEGSSDPWQQRMAISEMLFEGETPFQSVQLFQNLEFGRVLTLDGIVQTTEADEYVYHEMLNQVPLLAHGSAQSVLIIGGGDGGSLREVLRHPTVQRVTMVELDGMVQQLCEKYLPTISQGAFNDPRVQLLIQDGIEYVRTTDARFDVIICDTTDPVGPGEVLFTPEFYANCKRILNTGGVIATQNGVPFTNGRTITTTYAALASQFASVQFYTAAVPTYIGGLMAFGFATDDLACAQVSIDTLQQRLATLPGTMRYYTPAVHIAAFALPQYVLQHVPVS